MSARDQLERLLYVLAEAARTEGARIDDLARALDVSPSTILADIEEATARAFYHPAGSTEAFTLAVDGDVVRMYSGSEFKRPVRLNQAEAMALGLGLRVLAAEAAAGRREEILALATRLEKELVTPDVELQPMLAARGVRADVVEEAARSYVELSFGEDDYRGLVADAIEQRMFCDVVYLRAGASGPAQRVVAPLRLLYGSGHWYMSAVEQQSGEPRVYRLDRILALTLTDETHNFDIPDERATTFATAGGTPVTVRYSPEVARWVAERQNAQCEADGTLVLTHDVVDMNWLVRHVLQYAGEAVVENPAARRLVTDAMREIA